MFFNQSENATNTLNTKKPNFSRHYFFFLIFRLAFQIHLKGGRPAATTQPSPWKNG